MNLERRRSRSEAPFVRANTDLRIAKCPWHARWVTSYNSTVRCLYQIRIRFGLLACRKSPSTQWRLMNGTIAWLVLTLTMILGTALIATICISLILVRAIADTRKRIHGVIVDFESSVAVDLKATISTAKATSASIASNLRQVSSNLGEIRELSRRVMVDCTSLGSEIRSGAACHIRELIREARCVARLVAAIRARK